MEILYLMLPLAGLLAAGIGIVFVWAVNQDQFEDLDGPGQTILQDDDSPSNVRESDG